MCEPCALCGVAFKGKGRERTFALPAALEELGVEGVRAHPSCVTEAREKKAAADSRRGRKPATGGTSWGW